MVNDNRPLYSLTVQEFIELSRQILKDNQPAKVATDINDKADIIYIHEACLATGYTESTMYSKVSKKEVPVISNGKPLTFSRKALNKWMLEGRPSLPESIASRFMKNNK